MANPAVGADDVATIVASRSSSASTDDGTPPTYGYAIAVVTVANGFSTITNSNIRDVRANATVNLGSSSVSSGWLDLGYTPNTITYNGNRSYSLVYNSVDLTSTVSPGMRKKFTRLITAPTQCTSLNGTNQYYNKTSPAAMTFTNNFVVSAWVKLTSYAAGTIASRFNGTSGWALVITSTGQVSLAGYNAGSGNTKNVTSYQSIPLNKWIHVVAQLDMTASTISPTVNYVMIDGVDCPAIQNTAGTNPTALVQAGNLEIGSQNAGTVLFPGKIAQVAIYNAKVTQANIRATISQGLTGSETSLISAYSFNNSFNDLSANANNLTAQGVAVATAADSPFSLNAFGTTAGTTDYGIVTSCTFSTNTTVVVQLPEGNAIPTTGGVSAVAYSTQKAPFGMPVQRGKWRVEWLARTSTAQSSPVTSTWYNLDSLQLNIPVGDWICGYEGIIYVTRGNVSGTVEARVTVSTANNSEVDTEFTSALYGTGATSGVAFELLGTLKREKHLSLSAATTYYMNASSQSAGATTLQLQGSRGVTRLSVDLATL